MHRRNEGAGALAGSKLSPVAIALLAEEEERGLAGCLLEGISSAFAFSGEGLHGKASASHPPAARTSQRDRQPSRAGRRNSPHRNNQSFSTALSLLLPSSQPCPKPRKERQALGAETVRPRLDQAKPRIPKAGMCNRSGLAGQNLSLVSNIFHVKTQLLPTCS